MKFTLEFWPSKQWACDMITIKTCIYVVSQNILLLGKTVYMNFDDAKKNFVQVKNRILEMLSDFLLLKKFVMHGQNKI